MECFENVIFQNICEEACTSFAKYLHLFDTIVDTIHRLSFCGIDPMTVTHVEFAYC